MRRLTLFTMLFLEAGFNCSRTYLSTKMFGRQHRACNNHSAIKLGTVFSYSYVVFVALAIVNEWMLMESIGRSEHRRLRLIGICLGAWRVSAANLGPTD